MNHFLCTNIQNAYVNTEAIEPLFGTTDAIKIGSFVWTKIVSCILTYRHIKSEMNYYLQRKQ